MSEAFRDAARRHWRDACLLDEEQRSENADHHYGFAAECALKTALQTMRSFRDDEHRKHIDVLWNKMRGSAFQRAYPGLARLLARSNPFVDWGVEQRYHADGAISDAAVRTHRDYARRLLIAVQLYRG